MGGAGACCAVASGFREDFAFRVSAGFGESHAMLTAHNLKGLHGENMGNYPYKAYVSAVEASGAELRDSQGPSTQSRTFPKPVLQLPMTKPPALNHWVHGTLRLCTEAHRNLGIAGRGDGLGLQGFRFGIKRAMEQTPKVCIPAVGTLQNLPLSFKIPTSR